MAVDPEGIAKWLCKETKKDSTFSTVFSYKIHTTTTTTTTITITTTTTTNNNKQQQQPTKNSFKYTSLVKKLLNQKYIKAIKGEGFYRILISCYDTTRDGSQARSHYKQCSPRHNLWSCKFFCWVLWFEVKILCYILRSSYKSPSVAHLCTLLRTLFRCQAYYLTENWQSSCCQSTERWQSVDSQPSQNVGTVCTGYDCACSHRRRLWWRHVESSVVCIGCWCWQCVEAELGWSTNSCHRQHSPCAW